MNDAQPEPSDLMKRVELLESRVAWLMDLERRRSERPAPQDSGADKKTPALPPSPEVPKAPVDRPIRKPVSPVVFIAGAGAFIFLVGAIFVFQWAIEQGWITQPIRFLLGLGLGSLMALGAARLILGNSPGVGTALLAAGLGTLQFSLYVGAFRYHMYEPILGFAGVCMGAFLAGGLSAKARRQGPLLIAWLSALAAPVVFSSEPHREIALSLYLASLLGVSTLVFYLARTGAKWIAVRWVGVLGTWFFLTVAGSDIRSMDAPGLIALLGLHLILAFIWIWLPGQQEEEVLPQGTKEKLCPSTPTVLWFIVSLWATLLFFVVWKRAHWPVEWFSGLVLLLSALQLAAVRPLRLRLDSRKADLGLLILAGGHLALAVPVALDWRWVGPIWGIFALLAIRGRSFAAEHPENWEKEEIRSLTVISVGMLICAWLRWLVHIDGHLGSWSGIHQPIPFLNSFFLEGVFLSLGSLLLLKWPKPARILGFIGLETAANLALALEISYLITFIGGTDRAGSMALTLVWALSGAAQWLISLGHRERLSLTIAGYALLGIAAVKLILVDLATAGVALRALVFLGVGTIFLGTALLANRVKGEGIE